MYYIRNQNFRIRLLADYFSVDISMPATFQMKFSILFGENFLSLQLKWNFHIFVEPTHANLSACISGFEIYMANGKVKPQNWNEKHSW